MHGGMKFVFVMARDFANNAIRRQRFVVKTRFRLLAKCSATLHLEINPDPLFGF